jgi:predicted solute-binding protein
MYVNDFTRDYGPSGREAIRLFLTRAHQAGYIEKAPAIEFAE